MTLLLGIDLGTSSAKAVLVEAETMKIVAYAGQEYPVHKPAPDRTEQAPEDWWHTVIAITKRVIAESQRSDVAAISFSGQMHGGVLLDSNLKPLHPAIIWADQRSAQQVQLLRDTLGDELLLKITGTLPAAGFMFPTLVWIKQNQPELLNKTEKFVLPKDYVRLKMTGEITTDPSDASSTGFFDIQKGIWAYPLTARFALPEHIFPTVIASHQVAGELSSAAAEALGLPRGIPVIAGCADQPAQALGNGIIAPGTAAVTIGSGGQVFTALKAPDCPDARLHIFNHAVPETWYALGAILSGGLSLRWLRGVCGLSDHPEAYERLSTEAAAVPPGADGLMFLPYLMGERTPHMDAEARGVFIGLSNYHTRGHLARAVMEGVTFALKEAFEIALEVGGTADLMIASGGGMESPLWRQIVSDVFGIPLRKSLQQEQAALGAAVLAGVGIGAFAPSDHAIQNFINARGRVAHYGDLTEPNSEHQAIYQTYYAHFLELYPLLKKQMHWLSRSSLKSKG